MVQNKVEAAYRRTDLFERRRRLMDDWADYLAGETLEPEAAPSRRTTSPSPPPLGTGREDGQERARGAREAA